MTKVDEKSYKMDTINCCATASEISVVEVKLNEPDIALYPARYLMLLLFCLYSLLNAFQWIQYAIISDRISFFYDIEDATVNWLSMVYMVVYIPLIFPASWLLDKKGLRVAVLLGSFGTCLGAWIKVFSTQPDRFAVTMAGQSLTAISQVFVLGIPPALAATWFSAESVSSACAVGVFGNQVGIALGFLIPSYTVPATTDKVALGRNLSHLFYGVAAASTVLFGAIVIAFKERPPKPPSKAQMFQQDSNTSYAASIKELVKSWNFILLLLTYGINVGAFYAISTLLNQVVLLHHPDAGSSLGWMGLSLVVAGMVGSVVCGFVLDKTHKFKETTLAIYVLSFLGMVAFTFVLELKDLWPSFIVTCFLGFFMTGYLPVGFEFAAEITYPQPEGTSSGLLNAAAQVFGITFTIGATKLISATSDRVSNLTIAGFLLVGVILTGLIRAEFKRRKAQEMNINGTNNIAYTSGDSQTSIP